MKKQGSGGQERARATADEVQKRIIQGKLSRGENLYPDEEALLARENEKKNFSNGEKKEEPRRGSGVHTLEESPRYKHLLDVMKERINTTDPLGPEDEAFLDECEVEFLNMCRIVPTSAHDMEQFNLTKEPDRLRLGFAFSPVPHDLYMPKGISRYEYIRNIVTPIDREKIKLRPKVRALVQNMTSSELLYMISVSPGKWIHAVPGFYRAVILEIEDRGLVPAKQ